MPARLLLLGLLGLLAAVAAGARAAAPSAAQLRAAEGTFLALDSAKLGVAAGAVVAALGDVNGDNTDVAWVDTQTGCVRFALWRHDTFAFESEPYAVCASAGQVVWNVLLTDLDYDGRLDVVLATTAPLDEPWGGRRHLPVRLCLVAGQQLAGSTAAMACTRFLPDDDPAGDLLGQYTAVSVNGQMRADLFGPTDGSRGNANHALISLDTATRLLWRRQTSPFAGACSIAAAHSNAFVDVNGDCAADLVLTCAPTFTGDSWTSALEVWLARPGSDALAYEKGAAVLIARRIGPVSFADVDGDGDYDIVYVACADQGENTTCDTGSELYVHYNEQRPLCASGVDASACRAETELCVADASFHFGAAVRWLLDDGAATEEPELVLRQSVPGPSSSLPTPLPVRWGDYNMDGFPDALVTVRVGEDTRVRLLRSTACGSACPFGAKRRLVVDADATAAITSLPRALSAFFLDLDEDGRLDVLATVLTAEGQVATVAFYNNIYEDAFFMKTLGLNGICLQNCGIAVQPVGVNEPGVTVRFLVTDAEGVKRIVQGSQLTQFCFGALLTPYVAYGLGRTNSYIDQFAVGLPMVARPHYHVWNGIIPNSQLVISPSLDESGWQMELYILPSVYSGWVALALLVTTVVLVLVVAALHWLEVRQDARERRGALMFVNFDVF